jgi:hypothetical protein
LLTQTPFRIYSHGGRVSLEEGDHVIAEVDKSTEDSGYFVRAKVPIMVDAASVSEETKINHGCKIVFLGNYSSKDGSHILIPVFSKVYLEENGSDQLSSNNKTIFFPKRKFAHAPRVPMDRRIMMHKWNYEERDHLK